MHADGSSAVRLPRAQPPNARAGFVLRLLLIGGARLLHHYVQTSERLLVWNARRKRPTIWTHHSSSLPSRNHFGPNISVKAIGRNRS